MEYLKAGLEASKSRLAWVAIDSFDRKPLFSSRADGFNKTTPTLFVTDLLKSWLVGFAVGSPFLAGFLWVFRWAGDRIVSSLMAFLLIFQLSMVVLYPTVIQPLCNKLSPLPDGDLRTRITGLASKVKFPLKHLYEIDGSKRNSHSNAYFSVSPGCSKHIAIFDTLMAEEVDAVLPDDRRVPALLNASTSASTPMEHAMMLAQMLLTPMEAVVGITINAVSRKFEYEADQFACELETKLQDEKMGDMGDRLGRVLITLHVENLSTGLAVAAAASKSAAGKKEL
ncbi:hypothetical protein C8Q74DRAFT_1452300 [Fomes fomentarius]|nr:hypothetical protein C8Q74DRAFT_1452300 [Fomes fomentarius]